MTKTLTRNPAPAAKNSAKPPRRKAITAKEHGPDPMDVHVGHRLKLRRQIHGLSQEKLADAVGVTFQQVQKYEKGSNRISCSRLYDLSRVLGVPVGWFFEDFADDAKRVTNALPIKAGVGIHNLTMCEANPWTKTKSLEILKAFWSLPDDQRHAIENLLNEMAPKTFRPEFNLGGRLAREIEEAATAQARGKEPA